MKVLVISHMYPNQYSEVYGIFVHEQVKELIKQGCDVKVISPLPWIPFPINRIKEKWKAYSQNPRRLVWDGVEVYYPRYIAFLRELFSASSGERMYRGIKNLIEQLYQKFPFDLIHANVALPDGFAGMRLANKFGKPFVVTIHGRDAYVTIEKDIACRKNIETVLRNANKIVVVSNRLGTILNERIGAWVKAKMEVIGNGVDTYKVFNATDLDVDYKHQKVILTVGYFIEQKAHRYVLQSISRLIDHHTSLKYLIIGNGPERENLRFLVKELGLQGRVKFLGLLSHEEVMSYMKLCDIFVLPSWNEGFGVVYIEAMAHGKPVIACKGGGIEDIIQDGKTGLLVKPRDEDSLAKALEYLLRNSDEAKRIGGRAQRLVLDNYTWVKNAEKTIEVYRGLLE